MMDRVADLVDVIGAHALLRRGDPGARRHALAHEIRLELHHPRGGIKQARVIRHKRIAGVNQVPLALEEFQIFGSKFAAKHELNAPSFRLSFEL